MISNISLLLLSLLFSSAFFFSTSASVVGGRKAAVGDWTPVKDVNDPHIQEIARFALSEYNARSKLGVKVKLVKVLKGETQVLDGTNFHLVLDTITGTASEMYDVVVYEEVWEHTKHLISFVPNNKS